MTESMAIDNSGIYPSKTNLFACGSRYYKWANVYTTKLNNGADLAVPTTGGTIARVEDIADAVANIDALPDQSGNAGKVLTTDGSTASWQEPQGGGTKIIIKRYN